MNVDTLSGPGAPFLRPEVQPPRSPREAAEQFESVMIRQFLSLMLQQAFTGTEDESPWIQTQRSVQLDTLSQTLAEALAGRRLLNISDTLLRQWQQAGLLPDNPTKDRSQP